ncbi:MAG TPA: bifunctional phosphoribosyl-AMP cyclohydrolase/phosphoribosyl-ATP diphosphatase HisIE [Rhizomicrobium sp.]|jgi:phosphoribosyl-ATP pyrophosphohydrolase/phosphoribosyl-AMP cyclohydrolase|nr:bifunctional phosphoribosyl-AMP cyclohydrolase/phosphoribosyl-ATP diphosphatase HisIE [Rhizomicrobium sp.]
MTSITCAAEVDAVDWAKGGGLVPAIVQDVPSLRVLMLGYMNRAALQQTLETRHVTFYSRGKHRLWEKGETSGNTLVCREIRLDCDRDTLLVLAEPNGPTCHLGTPTCFGDHASPGLAILADLAATIRQRRRDAPADSYTATLFASGMRRIAQKVGEEGVEVALAAGNAEELAAESADLLYHLLVLLEAGGVSLQDVMTVLRDRAQTRGPS